MSRHTSRTRRLAVSLTLAAAALALAAAPAQAAPALGVDISRDSAEYPTVHRGDQRTDYTVKVKNEGDEATAGKVTLKVELPAGMQTYAHKVVSTSSETTPPAGWSCTKAPATSIARATVTCSREDALGIGAEYPPVRVIVALGADAPDAAVATATAFGGGSVTASDEETFIFAPAKPFGLTEFEAELRDSLGAPYTQAGGHPFDGYARFVLASERLLVPEGSGPVSKEQPVGHTRQVIVDIPPGIVGNAQAIPELCPSAEQIVNPFTPPCPEGSKVGEIVIDLTGLNGATFPIYAIEPEFGTPAQFAFTDSIGGLYTLSARVRPADNYAVSLELAPAAVVELLKSEATICNFGVRPTGGCKAIGEESNAKPLFTNPTRCITPVSETRLDSWEDPGNFVKSSFVNEPITGCEEVGFEPEEVKFTPTASQADSPTGLEVEISMPTDGLEDPEGISQAHLKEAKVTFPEGMAVNASAGQGLGACSLQQAGVSYQEGRLVADNEPASCPGDSKIGTVEIETPIIRETLTGDVFIAEQGAIGGALVGFFMVFESAKDGIVVKMPARVDADPVSGRLTTTVAESPQQPFSSVRLRFPGGNRATLLNPPTCGSYEFEAELTPWDDGPSVTKTSSYEVTSGPGSGPCPVGALDAGLRAGSTDPLAGRAGPFELQLTRPDGSDRFTALGLRLPRGLTAYLKGVPYCPQPGIDQAKAREAQGGGQAEVDSPSCPAASQIGRVVGGAGGGPDPLYVETGKAYLAGPYKGAPLSVVAVVPALAGPLDLGTIVVRNAVHVDPKSAEISVISDELPTIKHGLLLDVRDVRVLIDRPGFALNPTSCAEKQVGATVSGLGGGVQGLANRYRLGGCRALGFKPQVKLRLFGKTSRGSYQGVRAVVRPRSGDANISRTVVRFPRSAFVAQEHIRTVCTRVQYAADACPKGSIYGRAIAYSPLIDYPLRGNVYLRSSDNTLPDAVADLRGPAHQPVRIEVAIRNDSVKGALRNTVQAVPDAPVSYFRLQLFGKRKGLIVNSRNICKGKNRARVGMRAHSGRRHVENVNVFNRRCARRAGRR